MAKKRTLSQLIRQEYEQKLLFNPDSYIEYSPDWAVESCSGATLKTPAPEQKASAPEQKASAPEHIAVLEQPLTQSALIQKHWVEIYTGSSRKNYYYYRYVWMEGRKLHHVHIGGNALYAKANATKELVEEAIALGKSPTEIIALIKNAK